MAQVRKISTAQVYTFLHMERRKAKQHKYSVIQRTSVEDLAQHFYHQLESSSHCIKSVSVGMRVSD